MFERGWRVLVLMRRRVWVFLGKIDLEKRWACLFYGDFIRRVGWYCLDDVWLIRAFIEKYLFKSVSEDLLVLGI